MLPFPGRSNPVVKFHRFFCNTYETRPRWALQEAIYNSEGAGCSPQVLFPTRETVALGSPLGAALDQPRRGTVLSEYSQFYHPSKAVLLSLYSLGRCFSLTTIFWDFSQWCLVYGYLEDGLFVRGTEVGNDLCHHLDDITLLFQYKLLLEAIMM